MINNAGSFKTPFSYAFALCSEVSVFVIPHIEGSEVSISVLNGEGEELYLVTRGVFTRIGGIFVQSGQRLETKIEGGGSVFYSYLEDSSKLLGGVCLQRTHVLANGMQDTFLLPSIPKDRVEVHIFINGVLVNDWLFSDNKESIIFKEPPFRDAHITLELITPQEYEMKELLPKPLESEILKGCYCEREGV